MTDKKGIFCNSLMNVLPHPLPENLHGLNLKLKLLLILIEIWDVCLPLLKKKKSEWGHLI